MLTEGYNRTRSISDKNNSAIRNQYRELNCPVFKVQKVLLRSGLLRFLMRDRESWYSKCRVLEGAKKTSKREKDRVIESEVILPEIFPITKSTKFLLGLLAVRKYSFMTSFSMWNLHLICSTVAHQVRLRGMIHQNKQIHYSQETFRTE